MAIFEVEGVGLLGLVSSGVSSVANRVALALGQVAFVLFGTATYETLGDNSRGGTDAVGLGCSGRARGAWLLLVAKDAVEEGSSVLLTSRALKRRRVG